MTGGTSGSRSTADGGGRRLSALRRGESGRVSGVDPTAPAPVARRLRDLGFRRDTVVSFVRRAPLGSPTIYRVGEADVCLRRAEASTITVEAL
jgi:ferrous iron transport protein A